MSETAIAENVLCVRCAYNLRTLTAGQLCPECATPVSESLAHLNASLRGTRRLAIGAALLGAMFVHWVFRSVIILSAVDLPRITGGSLDVVVTLVFLAGATTVVTAIPASRAVPMRRQRSIIIATAVLAVVFDYAHIGIWWLHGHNQLTERSAILLWSGTMSAGSLSRFALSLLGWRFMTGFGTVLPPVAKATHLAFGICTALAAGFAIFNLYCSMAWFSGHPPELPEWSSTAFQIVSGFQGLVYLIYWAFVAVCAWRAKSAVQSAVPTPGSLSN